MFNVFGFYKFKKLKFLKKKKYLLQNYLIKKNIRGTIILAKEGVNATIAGKYVDIKFIINKINKTLDIKNFDSENISNIITISHKLLTNKPIHLLSSPKIQGFHQQI